ncbi:hypothetical protein [Streptomyces sp. NPDC048581]|uniref:hypothetical protein n=1 Tax=unclassified Streptomyces TaxID=2593676 RepID=UPI00371DB536
MTTEHRGAEDPGRVPVDRLVTETGNPRARLAGADLVAVIGDGESWSGSSAQAELTACPEPLDTWVTQA